MAKVPGEVRRKEVAAIVLYCCSTGVPEDDQLDKDLTRPIATKTLRTFEGRGLGSYTGRSTSNIGEGS